MIRNKKDTPEGITQQQLAIPTDGNLALQPSDLLPGDVLLYRPRSPNVVQRAISSATGSPYTHAAIYLGAGIIAESGVPFGVTRSALQDSLHGSDCIGVLRSQLGFGGDRPNKLNEFVGAVMAHNRFYDFVAAATFSKRSVDYFANQLEFVRKNYGKVTSHEEFAEQSFFCSAFVVACYAVVGVIGETAQVAYQPNNFSPGHLGEDPTFGWLLGYLIPEGGAIPPMTRSPPRRRYGVIVWPLVGGEGNNTAPPASIFRTRWFELSRSSSGTYAMKSP